MSASHRRRVPIDEPPEETGGLVGNDLLIGIDEIAEFLFGKDVSQRARKRLYREFELGHWPHWKRGGRIVASREALTEHYRSATRGKTS